MSIAAIMEACMHDVMMIYTQGLACWSKSPIAHQKHVDPWFWRSAGWFNSDACILPTLLPLLYACLLGGEPTYCIQVLENNYYYHTLPYSPCTVRPQLASVRTCALL